MTAKLVMYSCNSRKFLSFLRQPAFIKIWFVPLWISLGLAKILIFLVSFKIIAPYLGVNLGLSPPVSYLLRDEEQRAILIGRAVRLAAKYTPWNSNCFPQAIVARALLGFYRIPYVLYFGLRLASTAAELEAHAWVCAGKVSVTGGTSFDRFTIVGVFASGPITTRSA